MSGMASFLVGLGGGYIKAKDKQYDRDRQAKEDEWRDEQRGRQRGEWAKSDRLEADVAEASKPMAAATGHQVTDAADSNAFTKDADAAAMMTDMAQAKNGQATSAAATRVGEQSYTDKAQADKALTDANSEQGVAQRQAQAYRDNGKPLEANQMQSAAMDLKAKQLGLSVAEMDFADKITRKQMGEALASGKSWHEGAAKFITESQYPGIKDVKAESVVSPDGKNVTLFAVKPDGTREARGTFPAGEEGALAFMEKFGSLPIEVRMSLMQGRASAAQNQANSDRDFDLRKRESESQMEYRNRTLAIQQSQEARSRATHSATMEDAKIPPGVKLQAATLAKQMENIGTALNKAMAEGQFDPKNAGTAKLIEQQAALSLKYSQLIKPYIPGAGGNADPLGLDKPAPGPAAQPPVAAAAPAARPQAAAPMQTATAPPAQKPPNLVQSLAGPGASAPLMQAAQQKAQTVQALADTFKQAQAGVVAAANSQNPAAVQAAMQRVQVERAKLNQAVAGMNPQQAKQVLAAVGIQ